MLLTRNELVRSYGNAAVINLRSNPERMSFYICKITIPIFLTRDWCLCASLFPLCLCLCLCSVSMAPPPPPMPQLTPQIPLTGFVARVQENSKSHPSMRFAACCPRLRFHPSVCAVEDTRIAIVHSVRFKQYTTIKPFLTRKCVTFT